MGPESRLRPRASQVAEVLPSPPPLGSRRQGVQKNGCDTHLGLAVDGHLNIEHGWRPYTGGRILPSECSSARAVRRGAAREEEARQARAQTTKGERMMTRKPTNNAK